MKLVGMVLLWNEKANVFLMVHERIKKRGKRVNEMNQSGRKWGRWVGSGKKERESENTHKAFSCSRSWNGNQLGANWPWSFRSVIPLPYTEKTTRKCMHDWKQIRLRMSEKSRLMWERLHSFSLRIWMCQDQHTMLFWKYWCQNIAAKTFFKRILSDGQCKHARGKWIQDFWVTQHGYILSHLVNTNSVSHTQDKPTIVDQSISTDQHHTFALWNRSLTDTLANTHTEAAFSDLHSMTLKKTHPHIYSITVLGCSLCSCHSASHYVRGLQGFTYGYIHL